MAVLLFDIRCLIPFPQSLTMQMAPVTMQMAHVTPVGSPQPQGWMRKMQAVDPLMRQLPWILPSEDPAPHIMEVLLQSHSCQTIPLVEVKKEFLEKIMVRTVGCH